MGDEEKRYQEDPERLLRIAPISFLLCVSGVVGTWASAVKIDQVKVRVNKLYVTVTEAVVDFSSIHGHYSCARVCTMGGRSGCKHGRCFWWGSDTFVSVDFLLGNIGLRFCTSDIVLLSLDMTGITSLLIFILL